MSRGGPTDTRRSDDDLSPGEGTRPPVGRALASAWSAPLWAHALAALGLLVALAFVVHVGVGYTSDEGAGVAQAHLLERGTWLVTNPVPTIDSDGGLIPFPLADIGQKGMAPYAKHPLFPLLLRAADDVGGARGMLALSIGGTIGAAVAGALIARRLHPTLARPALWVLALGSPLLFDSYLLLAHTMGAAAFGLATVAALNGVLGGSSRRRRLLWLALMAALVMTAVALRTEAVFAGLGLAAGALVVAWKRPDQRGPALQTGVVAAAAATLTVVVERAVRLAITGPATAMPGDALTFGTSAWLPGRAQAVWHDWFDPGVGAISPALSVTILATAVMLAYLARRAGRDRATALVVVLAIAAAGYGLRLATWSPTELFGLVVAFPLLWLGLLLLRRGDLESPSALLLVTTLAVFAVGVFATDYAVGGSAQWGGRYFALGLPLAVPLALVALRRVVRSMPSPSRRPFVAGLVACCLLTSALSLQVLHVRRGLVVSLGHAVADATAVAGPSGVGDHPDRPLVVVGNRLGGQVLYPDLDRYTWLAGGRAQSVRDALARSAAAGVTRATVVNPPEDDSLWPGWRQVGRWTSDLADVAVIEVCPVSGC